MQTATAPIEILLVEDNPADVRLTVEALRQSSVQSRLRVARDGQEAMRVLRAVDNPDPMPDLILLDLNLPKMDGREVLEAIKTDDMLRHIPVVVLTTSRAEADIFRSYRVGANAVITKPVDLDQFFASVHAIEQFWLSNARLLRPYS
ncbi:MAG: response regulator [Vicinamibacterales bacterium]